MPASRPLASRRKTRSVSEWQPCRGNRTALAAFWQELAAHGAPLIETANDDNQQVLVTFLWRANEPLQKVILQASALGIMPQSLQPDPARNQLQRLADTALWYKTYRLPKNLRTVYRFAIYPASAGGAVSQQADPLNPKTFVFPKDPDVPASKDVVRSLLEMPAAAPQLWIYK